MKTRTPPKVQNYIRTFRKRSGLTQAEVAFLLGCRTSTKVSRYERSVREPSLRTALALEALFQIPVRTIFEALYDDVLQQVGKHAQSLCDCLSDIPDDGRKKETLQRIEAPKRSC